LNAKNISSISSGGGGGSSSSSSSSISSNSKENFMLYIFNFQITIRM
jgi:hypothetical protein